jgi:hypothetical protein
MVTRDSQGGLSAPGRAVHTSTMSDDGQLKCGCSGECRPTRYMVVIMP